MSEYPKLTTLPEPHHNRVRMNWRFYLRCLDGPCASYPRVLVDTEKFLDCKIVISEDVEDYEFYECSGDEADTDRACPTCGHMRPMTNAERQRKYRASRGTDG